MLKIYENFDLIHITIFRFNFRIKCRLLFQYLLVEVVGGLFVLETTIFCCSRPVLSIK